MVGSSFSVWILAAEAKQIPLDKKDYIHEEEMVT
jgi:hypothetical protein